MNINRRSMLQLLSSFSATLALPSLADTGGHKQSTDDDYKALVCLYLYGGNDSWNLLVPLKNEHDEASKGRGYQTYQARRADMSIHAEALPLPTTISAVAQNAYFSSSLENSYRRGVFPIAQDHWGIHGCAPELAHLWKSNKLAWVINTGVLKSPFKGKQQTLKNRPAFLFAHNHQQHALFTGDATGNSRYGWGMGHSSSLWRFFRCLVKDELGY